jgi:hypothetical protein
MTLPPLEFAAYEAMPPEARLRAVREHQKREIEAKLKRLLGELPEGEREAFRRLPMEEQRRRLQAVIEDRRRRAGPVPARRTGASTGSSATRSSSG